MKLFFSFLFTFCLSVSCINQTKTDDYGLAKYNFKIEDPWGEYNSQTNNYDDYIMTKKFIPLQTKPGALISEITKLRIFNDNIFLSDYDTKSLFIYTINGELVYRINSVGKGPGEYIKISDFTIDRDRNEIIILDGIALKCLVYDFLGNHKRDFKLKTHAKKFEYIGKGKFALYNDYNGRLKNNRYNLFFTSMDGSIKEKYFVFDKKYLEMNHVKSNYFYTSNGGQTIDFLNYYDNNLYRLEDAKITKYCFFDFGKYTLPQDYILNKDNIHKEKSKYVFQLTNFAETSNTLSLSYFIGGSRPGVVFFNKKTENAVHSTFNNWEGNYDYDNLFFFRPPLTVYNDYFVTYRNADIVSDYITNCKKELLQSSSQKNENFISKTKGLEQVEKMDNPVLFFYKFNNF